MKNKTNKLSSEEYDDTFRKETVLAINNRFEQESADDETVLRVAEYLEKLSMYLKKSINR